MIRGLLFFITGIPVKFVMICLIYAFFIMPVNVYAQTFYSGDTVALGSGYAFTFVETDAQNVPLRIGLSLSAAAVNNPASGLKSVDFPLAASDSLFRHAYFAFEPNGHAPTGIYDLPHFDIHFYMITRDERLTILQGVDTTFIHPSFMPEDYFVLPDIGYFSLPQMGVHFVDSTAGELHGQTFDKTLLYGFYKAKMIFVEPMITRDFLLTQPDTLVPIKQPEEYQRTAYYPESYVIRFNNTDSLYEIFITDFVLQSGVTSIDHSPLPALTNDFTLYQNYPNPFNPSTVIRFGIASESRINIAVYNILGELVEILADGVKSAGSHSIIWNPGNELSSGIYIYNMTAVSETQTFSSIKKMILIR